MIDLDDARFRLREWAGYYRDRRRSARAGSAEGNLAFTSSLGIAETTRAVRPVMRDRDAAALAENSRRERLRPMLLFRLTAQSIALTLGVVLAVQAASVDDLISGSFNAKAWDERSRLARAILADVDKLADVVQTPRPWAVAWVEEEKAAILRLGGAAAKVRSFQLVSSVEYHHVKLYNNLQEIKKAFRCVIDPATGLQREMYCWAAAAFLLGDRLVFEDGVKALQRDKRLPDDTRSSKVGAGRLDIGLRYEMYSRGIQEYLVLPYLSDDFK